MGERRGVRVRFKLVRCVAKNVDDSMTTISVPRKVADEREVYATNCGRIHLITKVFYKPSSLKNKSIPHGETSLIYITFVLNTKVNMHGKGFVHMCSIDLC